MAQTGTKPAEGVKPASAAPAQPAQSAGALAIRLPMPREAAHFGIKRGEWHALAEAIFPLARTPQAIMLALSYCRARGIDVFKRPVHIVPMWNAKLNREVETVWPGITEHRITAHRTDAYAGNDDVAFGPWVKDRLFEAESTPKPPKKGRKYRSTVTYPEWAQMTVYKIVQGHRVAFVGPKTYFLESFGWKSGVRVPNERWTRAPHQMLEKCAEAAALRRAFPEELGGQPVAEEMDGQVIKDGGVIVGKPDPEPQRSDFYNSEGPPQDGVAFADPGEDDEDDGIEIEVDASPADVRAMADRKPDGVIERDGMITSQQKDEIAREHAAKNNQAKEPVPAASGSPPAADRDPRPDVPDEGASPAGAGDGEASDPKPEPDQIDAEVEAETRLVDMLTAVVDQAVEWIKTMTPEAEVLKLSAATKAEIEAAAKVPASVRGKLRAQLQTATLERQKVLSKTGGRR
jgi:phage recombination protein Bet